VEHSGPVQACNGFALLDPTSFYQFLIQHNPKLCSVPVSIQTLYVTCGSGLGGLEVACWPLLPNFTGSQPAEAVGILGRKSKAVGRMS
jgi:hypothetical protein